MNKVIIIFGEMGIGKNYIGQKLALEYGYKFLDGDDFLPPVLKDKVKKFIPLTPDEIDDFVKHDLFNAIVSQTENVVIAQALYSRTHRKYLTKKLHMKHLNVEFVWVKCSSFYKHLKRLLSRPKGFMWVLYALANKPFFQKPDTRYVKVYVND